MDELDTYRANPRAWKGICWHHSASPDGQERNWNGIIRYHTSYRVDFNIVQKEEYERRLKANEGKVFQSPWSDVGYHGGIEEYAGIFSFFPGRPLSKIGAHAGVKNASNRFNTEYLGLCAIGNYDLAAPKPEIWNLALQVTREFMKTFNISQAHVIGHREVFDRLGVPRQKTCPGERWDMDLFRLDLNKKEA